MFRGGVHIEELDCPGRDPHLTYQPDETGNYILIDRQESVSTCQC